MILITGATGNLGHPLVAELAAKGAKVRALTRTPATTRFPDGVEVCDSAQPDFDGVTALLLNLAAIQQRPQALLDGAQTAGVRRGVTLSSLAVADDPDAGRGSTAAIHQELEEAVETAFPQWTHLRPGAFASNALQWKPQLQVSDVVRGPFAQSSTAPIVDADLAAVAVRALLDDELISQKPSLTGPEGLTATQQVEILGQVLGRPLRYEEITPETAKRAMLSQNPWVHEAAIDSLLSYLARTVGRPALVRGEVERILGRPARTYAQWAADHAAAFQN
jgi:uncharacterized protein YbjT (DUF2867 family)